MRKFRLKYSRNPLIEYLNINSLRSRINDVLEMISRLRLDYFVISKAKVRL